MKGNNTNCQKYMHNQYFIKTIQIICIKKGPCPEKSPFCYFSRSRPESRTETNGLDPYTPRLKGQDLYGGEFTVQISKHNFKCFNLQGSK